MGVEGGHVAGQDPRAGRALAAADGDQVLEPDGHAAQRVEGCERGRAVRAGGGEAGVGGVGRGQGAGAIDDEPGVEGGVAVLGLGEVGFGQLARGDIARPEAVALISWAARRVRERFVTPACAPRLPADDGGNHDVVAVAGRGVGEGLVDAERRARHVLAEDVLQLDHLGRGRDGVRVQLGQGRELVEDVVELALEARQLVIREAEPGEMGDVLDVGAREGPHGCR